MHPLILSLALLLSATTSLAQVRAPARALQPVTDPSMVINDRGAKLEIFPRKRATPRVDSSGRTVSHELVASNSSDPIGPQQLGVVFNHALQQQGFITGEITFKMKRGHTAEAFDPTLFPGLALIVKPALYAVSTQNPAQFIAVFRRLQARSDVEWVEPTINYTSASAAPSAR
jgi:hypothetical protein